MKPAAPRQVIVWLAVLLITALSATAHAGNLTQGLVDVVTGPLELPKQIVVGTFTGPPILGTIAGVFTGAFSAVGTTLRGVAELASGAISVGSTLAPYALPFIL